MIVVGTLVTPLNWDGTPLSVEPVAVVEVWRWHGQAWAKLANGRNYLIELLREELGNG